MNEQVKRNLGRFPPDFAFQLTAEEYGNLRSHFATSSSPGGHRYLPYAFTEQSVAMLSSVLLNPRTSPCHPGSEHGMFCRQAAGLAPGGTLSRRSTPLPR
jgi:hypothetical protein